MSWRLRAATGLLALLALDLLVVIITGDRSVLTPGRAVGSLGCAVRLASVACLLVVRHALMPRGRRGPRHVLVFALLLVPTIAQFQLAGGRINGDGIMYYVYVRSLWKDLDLDFANEYAHYGLDTRPDLAAATKTGLRRSIFSVGPAVVGSPFFLLGEGVGRVWSLAGGEVDLSGYGPVHRNAVALGNLLLGFAAVVLIRGLVARHFDEDVALGASLLTWGATFVHWYMVAQPTMSHAPSAFTATLAVWLWDRDRGRRTLRGWPLLGLVLGLAMSVRWQNGLLLALPGVELAVALRRIPGEWLRTVTRGALLGAGVFAGAFPQMAAWRALYGMWLLPYPPHGRDFVRLDHPFVLETLFSSRHGLLSWTPVFWLGFLGFLPLLRRRPRLAAPLLPLVVVMTYVNMCSGDWWAGASFSNRRFDSLLPILALGFAASWEVGQEALRRWPSLAVLALVSPFVAWNASVSVLGRRGVLTAGRPVSFDDLVGNVASLTAEKAGSPPTWPASWIFAAQTGRPPAQYDLLVGRYLFYRQNNMEGMIRPGDASHEALLGEGWGRIREDGEAKCRPVLARARLFAPLDVPEDLELVWRVRGYQAGELEVAVNGQGVGRIAVSGAWTEGRVSVPQRLWRRELNDVVVTTPQPVFVDSVTFVRAGAS